MIRLQKVLADRGVASRRAAEELITDGRVRVNGAIVTTLGTKVAPDARIEVDGATTHVAAARYLAMNKPKGIVSTAHDERGRRTVVDLVDVNERLYPVGRLDADSEGLLLLTNDGDWAERVLHPRYGHEREYEVTVTGDLSAAAIDQLRRGVRLEEGLARAERVDVGRRSRGTSLLRVVLRTGWKRQIRRMCAAVGLRVDRLVRIRIGTLSLGRLRAGDWRELTAREVADLARPMAGSAAAAAPKPSPRRAPRRSVATVSQGAGAPRREATPRGPSAQRPPRRDEPRSAPRPHRAVDRARISRPRRGAPAAARSRGSAR